MRALRVAAGRRFNSRLREEATRRGDKGLAELGVSTHASVRRRRRSPASLSRSRMFQLTPP